MKYTLLEMAQVVSSSYDGDAFNSITDSVESLQIATVIRTAYFDLISRLDLPEHESLFNLQASGDNTKPTLMFLPSDVAKIKWLEYNKIKAGDTDMLYQQIRYLKQDDFFSRMYTLSQTDSTTGNFNYTVEGSSVNFMYKNDAAPCFYTTFDDHTLIFDSVDLGVDTTLTAAKTLGRGTKVIAWTMADNFIPDLDEPQFALLLNEAKALAWTELKQVTHQKAEVNARRGWSRAQKTKAGVDVMSSFDKLPNFGRR